MKSGGRFLTELLVWSLLGGGGLWDALRDALRTRQSTRYAHLKLDTYVSPPIQTRIINTKISDIGI